MSATVLPIRPRHPTTPVPRLRLLATLVRNPLETMPQSMFREKIVSQRIFGRQSVYVLDPELIKTVMVDEVESFTKGDLSVRVLQPALGQGILIAQGSHWRWQRRATAPAFRHERIMSFLPEMRAAAEATAEQWRALPDGTELDVASVMMRTTFDIIVATMLSGRDDIDVDAVASAITDYLKPAGWQAILALLHAPKWMPYPGSRRADAARHSLRGTLARVIAERRQSPPRSDLIDLLFAAKDDESGRQMTDEEMVDNLLTFVAAGHETTALALTWTLYLLSQAPDIDARVRAEIEATAGDRPITAEMLDGLSYLRQVIQESMRLYPPVPIIVRQAKRPLSIGGIDLEEGARVQIPTYVVHRHQALWQDPDTFDPERFRPEAVKARHRYAYLPFGAGPRTCIGMSFAMLESTVILATLLRSARLKTVPGHEPFPIARITLRPRGGMPMRITPLG